MGWSWAMWFVQMLHEHVVSQEFDEEHIVRDSRPAPEMRRGETCASPFCDNLGVIGTDADRVLKLRESVQEGFEELGFGMHEETIAEGDAEILGGRFHGDQTVIRPSFKKFSRVVQACRWVSRRPRITGQEMERILGHCIFPRSYLTDDVIDFWTRLHLYPRQVLHAL